MLEAVLALAAAVATALARPKRPLESSGSPEIP